MSNALHIKGSRTKVLNTFPTNSFGNDGDIVASRIKGRGTFLCIKAGGMWYAANQLQELRNVSKTSLKQLKAKSISISGLSKSNEDTDKFVVSDGGTLKYRTGEEVLDDLDTDALSINYKTAYCSLAQYNNKEDCWANGGTWYYSENDSHDSISNTAENELLTIGSSIGKIDAESTLTYDGSTLEIKRNTDFDDNWQTSAQDTLLKLSYDSSNNALFSVDSSGNFTLDADGRVDLDSHTGYFNFYKEGDNTDYATLRVSGAGATTLSTTDAVGTAGHITLDADGNIFLEPAGLNTRIEYNNTNYFNMLIGANGAMTMSTVDSDGVVGHLTLDADGMIKLDAAAHAGEQGIGMLAAGTRFADFTVHHNASYLALYENGGDSTDDYLSLSCYEHGASILKTKDNAAAAAHLTVQIDGDIILEPVSGNTIFYGDSDDYFKINVAGSGVTSLTTADADGTAGHLTLQPNGDLILDPDSGLVSLPGSTLYIEEQADANASSAGYGQLWIHDDTPNTLMFTDDADQDIIISKNTAVWGGYFPRMTGQNGKWLGIPIGQLGTAISFGTTLAAPDTSYTISTTADDVGAVIWQSINGIRVTNCRIWYGQGGSTNTAHSLCLMRYDIDSNDGDLTNGVEVGGVDNDLGSDDYTTLARTNLTMTSDVTVSSTQVLIAMVYCVNAINAAFTAKCILEYEDIP